MEFFATTDTGKKRNTNQDFVFATDRPTGNLPNLFLVADGMGGHNAGDEASRLAVMTMVDFIRTSDETEPKLLLQSAIDAANKAVYEASMESEQRAGMGTTIIGVTVAEKITVFSIGDSRIYAEGPTGFYQVTKDHTMVGEMLRMGTITKNAAKTHPKRHVITRALGVEPHVKTDFFELSARDISALLMCSDGLYDMLDDEIIHTIISTKEEVSVRAKRLVDAANERGGDDNITVLLIDKRGEL